MSDNITFHASKLSKDDRFSLLGARGCLIWLTGLSGSGKSTIARALERELVEKGIFAYCLDGDNLRFGLNRDLRFTPEDRTENIRRVGEVAKLFVDSGMVVIASFISPFRQDRNKLRTDLAGNEFVEIHVATSLAVCEQRDPKGLYKRARAGEIPNFTGISSPYEEPLKPEIRLERETVEESVQVFTRYLTQHGFLSS